MKSLRSGRARETGIQLHHVYAGPVDSCRVTSLADANERTVAPAVGAPPVPERFVRRDRVLRMLAQTNGVPVVCLQAPGGYGKTTALAQWVAEDPRPAVWLSVRTAAADAAWLAQELVDGIYDAGLLRERPMLPSANDPVAWHLGTLPAVESAVSAAASAFLVVIDEAGSMSGDMWGHLVQSVATSLPPGAQLVLATRREIPTSLWRLRSPSDILTIGPDALALDAAESADLLRQLQAPVSDEGLKALLKDCEGWPVAVYLAGLSARSGANPRLRSYPLSSVRELSDYLRAEILDRLDAEDAEFLLRVSVLTELDEQACNSVTGGASSRARLRRLAAANNLLAPLDGADERFRMHPLLASFLDEEMRTQEPAGWHASHAAASVARERTGDLDAAVHHARLADDDHRLATLVWKNAARLLGNGQVAVLKRWIDGIDEDRLLAQCQLALAAAWVAAHDGDMARMARLALGAHATAAQLEPTMTLDADLLAAVIGVGGLEDIEQTSRAYIAGKAPDETWLTLAFYLLGVALVLQDHTDEGMAALQEGQRLSGAFGVPVMSAHCLAALADAALVTGDQRRALAAIHQVRELINRSGMHTIATAAPVFATSALGYVVEGRFADAKNEAARALRLTALIASMAPWYAVQGRIELAQVYLALGDSARAAILLDEAGSARSLATESPLLDRLFTATSERIDVATSAAAGPSTLTTAEVRVLQYLPTHLSFPEIADELFLSRHTVKTQALAAYRKLGAHTRTEAIRRARAAGLLPPA